MFGESESESPRVPSPWDSLISTPPSPSRSSSASPSPLSIELIPRLVPEADEGNVEYKLQLLSPSPARFARLVTQLKWRLLEGGGQAYYELGVADSGALVGLPRAELEQSLETLEMMAGEIGASVIVVKEIEVPAAMAGLAASQTDKWNGQRKEREPRPGSGSSTALLSSTSTTETETTTDYDDEDLEDMSTTIVLEKKSTGTAPSPASTHSSSAVSLASISSDLDPDPADNADNELDDDPLQQPSYIAIDLEISSVFKPRPMRARMQMHAHTAAPVKTKRLKRIKHITHPNSTSDSEHVGAYGTTGKAQHTHAHAHAGDPAMKMFTRRQIRDRKREEKRKALFAYAAAAAAISPSPSPGPVPLTAEEEQQPAHKPTPAETSALVSGLAALHVSLDEPAHPSQPLPAAEETHDDDDDDDVFASPTAVETLGTREGAAAGSRLIVEALVVRKMSLDEAFLDFGGFALM
ncbi:hypothetical protein D9615_005547 [Tricholomella constricta]|uniref:GTP binding protein 2 n=1 Tax=Tricholomella constricta TaxID=117010 RepID=A0A8H5HEK6_9AGAR|nr:hypothetical protein D9615_005547 [Tricholomella constricta]